MRKKYLITGGAGFIGSNCLARLLARGEQVTVYDNLSRVGGLEARPQPNCALRFHQQGLWRHSMNFSLGEKKIERYLFSQYRSACHIFQ